MMVNLSRRFFDLGEAVRLSRKIAARAHSGVVAHIDSPPRELPPARRPESGRDIPQPPPREVLPTPETGTVTDDLELWRVLLSWTQDATKAKGAFVLDGQGFVLADEGAHDPFPPEIFSETLVVATRLFSTYLAEDQRITSIALEFSPLGRFAIYPIALEGESVLLGIAGDLLLDTTNMSQICKTIAAEVAAFEQKTSPRTEDDKENADRQDTP
jgi:hypothetical protein